MERRYEPVTTPNNSRMGAILPIPEVGLRYPEKMRGLVTGVHGNDWEDSCSTVDDAKDNGQRKGKGRGEGEREEISRLADKKGLRVTGRV